MDSRRLVEFDGAEQHGFLWRLHRRVGGDRPYERGDLGPRLLVRLEDVGELAHDAREDRERRRFQEAS